MSISTPTARDDEMMERTLQEARNALEHGKAGVAALLLWRDEIIALAHNQFDETRDMTAHAEMTVFHQAAERLSSMSDEEKAEMTLYVTLEPCLMCFSASSFVGIKRIVFSAWNEDGKMELQIAHNITIEDINKRLVKGPIELVPGVRRDEGKAILARMNEKA